MRISCKFGFVILSAGGVLALCWQLVVPKPTAHPTFIPWLQEQQECERTDRLWQEDKCADVEHDPNF